MSDDSLISWLADGAPVALSAEERVARTRSEFSRRFAEALQPLGDLGVTHEEHELGVARLVYEVHSDLNALGDEAYTDVWGVISASDRRAIKAYVEMARRSAGN